MPYVITDICTRDGACVEVCPVACIHTTPDAPQFYIDPDICIECEQCAVVCPVDAIFLHTELPAQYLHSADVNGAFFRQNKPPAEPIHLATAWEMVHLAQAYAAEKNLKVTVAIVDGSGAPIVVAPMPGAAPNTAELAVSKAYTATGFWLPTEQVVPERRKPWFRSLVISSRGRIMAAGGGIPVVDGLTMIGAIGVAGGSTEEQDHLCCRAGLAAIDHHGH